MINNISIYVHWPWCKNICNYCDFYKFKNPKNMNYKKVLDSYTRDLKRLEKYTYNKKVISLNIGGGSPSVIPKFLLQELIEYIFKHYKLKKQCEISIEVNPQDLNKKKLMEYKSIGINRISIGVQSFNTYDLLLLNKRFRKNQAINSIFNAAKYFNNIGIDLIFGIPGSSRETFEKQLYFCRELPIKHISLYEFDFINKLQQADYLEDSSFYDKKKEILEEKNFIQYETSSYSISGYQSSYIKSVFGMKNFIGIGPSAHSRIASKSGVIKIKNTNNLESWLENSKNNFKERIMSQQKQIEELLILGLSSSEGVRMKDLKSVTKNNICKYISLENIKNLKKKNLILEKKERICLSTKGMLVINNIVSNILN